MNRVSNHLLAALAVLLLLPASALAALPRPDDAAIKVPTTIGGVDLKLKIKNADRAWGRTGDCSSSPGSRFCTYEGGNPRTGVATIDAAVHRNVSSFAIEAGRDRNDEYVFKGRLLKFETKGGIGLGDNGEKIPKAYPDAIRTANKTGYLIEGEGRSYMTIQTLDGKHITAISVVDGRHQG